MFIDTIVVCTMTALVILSSGVYKPQVYLSNMAHGIENVDGTTLTGEAFSTVIPFGDKFLAVSIVLFAFATMVGWAYLESARRHICLEKNRRFFTKWSMY